jgi:hypothetical protein
MTRRYDAVHALILLTFLVIANFVGNAVIKGVVLFLFAAVLILNTVLKLKAKLGDKISEQIFYWVLLVLDIFLAVGGIAAIIMALL